MNLNEFFKNLGYDIGAHNSFIHNILYWKQWYKGKVSKFHNYTVYNGFKDVEIERLSLQIPKFISEKMADLLFNEKVQITLGDEKSTEILDKILKDNKFQLLMNKGIEQSFAMGTGCIVADIDNIGINDFKTPDYTNSNVRLSFIPAENIYPLSWDNNGIKELAIVEYEKIPTSEFKCIIKLYVINDAGNYVIRNYQFLTDSSKNFTTEYVDDNFITEFDTKNNVKWFSIISPNITNNIDMYSPFGISIFANSIDVIKGIDIVYDSFISEIKLGRKRLFTTKELLRFNTTTGKQEFNFDPNDIVFHVLGDGFNDGDTAKNYIQEINGALRVEEHIKSLDSNLRILGTKTGFGSDYFTFEKTINQPNTATEVISRNNELFRTVTKHEILLEYSINDIIYAIADIGRLTNKFYIDTSKITVLFDDSIIESKDQERAEDRKDLSQDTLSRLDYIMKWRGLDRDSAKEKIKEIDNEVPAKENITFIDGEIN